MISEMPAWIQWCVSAISLVGCFELHEPIVRFVLRVDATDVWQAPKTVSAGDLVIDVLSTPRAASSQLAAASGHAAGVVVPLLLVRYMHVEGGARLRRCRAAVHGARPGMCAFLDAVKQAKANEAGHAPLAAASGFRSGDEPRVSATSSPQPEPRLEPEAPRPWARTLRAQGEEEVDVALECLRRNAEELPEQYRSDFYGASRHHDAGATGFKCSFLIPAVPLQKPQSVRL